MMARILLAEDDDNVRAVRRPRPRPCRATRWSRPRTAGSPPKSCEEQQGAFDLLLSDIKMPVMDGIALALNVAAAWPEVTIVLMTGFADQRERAHGLDALIYDVIPKPFTLQAAAARRSTMRWRQAGRDRLAGAGSAMG